MPGIIVFADELRDGLCGPVWEKDKGAFLAGVPGGEMSVKFGIVGAIKHPQVRCCLLYTSIKKEKHSLYLKVVRLKLYLI